MYAWKRRSGTWTFTLVACLLALFVGLQRAPAVTGLLLFVGILWVRKAGGLAAYLMLLIAVYFAGGALYTILSLLGVGSFAGSSTHQGWLATAAAGAPDIKDQVSFLRAWLAYNPPLTHGLTFVGGLVPGNYHWNSAVWSLSVANHSSDISSIASGGLRLPPPLWGLVSFGWAGVIGVSFVFGIFSGYFASAFRPLVEKATVKDGSIWLLIYVAFTGVVVNFYRMSYFSLIQLVVLVAVLLYGAKRSGVDVVGPAAGTGAGRRVVGVRRN
jgi:hypothetical protein